MPDRVLVEMDRETAATTLYWLERVGRLWRDERPVDLVAADRQIASVCGQLRRGLEHQNAEPIEWWQPSAVAGETP